MRNTNRHLERKRHTCDINSFRIKKLHALDAWKTLKYLKIFMYFMIPMHLNFGQFTIIDALSFSTSLDLTIWKLANFVLCDSDSF